MDFGLSESQRRWHEGAIAFAKAELQDDLLGRDERREFWREGWTALCPVRRSRACPCPREYGGQGEGLPETIAAMEGLGYGCPDNGLIFAINACLWTVTLPLVAFGTEDQKRRYLPRLCDGNPVGANAASEVEAGSDIFAMQDPGRTGRRTAGSSTAERPGSRADRSPTSSSPTRRPTRPRV